MKKIVRKRFLRINRLSLLKYTIIKMGKISPDVKNNIRVIANPKHNKLIIDP